MTIEVVKCTGDYEFAPNVLTLRYHVLVEVFAKVRVTSYSSVWYRTMYAEIV